MVSDSPYDSSELVLKPGLGVVAGIGGALLMLGLLEAFRPLSSLSSRDVLARIGSVVASGDAMRSSLVARGVALHLAVSGLLGLLYALSQRRVPHRGLIGVGVLFGFVVWVISSLVLGWFIDQTVRGVLRSWPWLLACLLYGLVLALVALWREAHRRPEERPTAVRD